MRADSWAATLSRSGAMPAVSAYWTAVGPVRARAAAAAIRSRGRRSAAGSPPARLITSGRAVRVSRSRMAEPRTAATRRARVTMTAPGDRGLLPGSAGRRTRRVRRPYRFAPRSRELEANSQDVASHRPAALRGSTAWPRDVERDGPAGQLVAAASEPTSANARAVVPRGTDVPRWNGTSGRLEAWNPTGCSTSTRRP